jgi:hypothetical protein
MTEQLKGEKYVRFMGSGITDRLSGAFEVCRNAESVFSHDQQNATCYQPEFLHAQTV